MFLKEKSIIVSMSYKENICRREVLKIYNFAIKKRKEGLGQRKISKLIQLKFNQSISEGAISNWE